MLKEAIMPSPTLLAKQLQPYGLHRTTWLARAIDVDEAQASRWLRGAAFSVKTAKKIAERIRLPWETVFSWQKDGR